MASKELEIEIGPDGMIKMTVVGIKGPACHEFVRQVMAEIGLEESFTPSSEYYEPEVHLDQEVEDRR